MRKILLAIIIGFGFSTVIVAAGSVNKIAPIQHWKTQSGVPVYFVESHELPMVDVRWLFKAGSAYDGAHAGLSEFTSDVLEEGTSTRDANAIAEAFDAVGAGFSHGVGRDSVSLTLRSLSDPQYLTPALSVFTDVYSHPVFSIQGVERTRQQLLASIRVSHQNPAVVASEHFFKTLYRDHPYAHPVMGTLDSIKAISAEQLRSFHQHFYVRENAQLLLVGDLTLGYAKGLAEKLSLALASGKAAPTFAQPKTLGRAAVERVPFSSNQTGIMIGLLGIKRDSPDYFPLVVGNTAFGGSGLTSMLFKEVRSKKGLAYRVRSTFDASLYRGPFFVALNTRASKAKEAEELVTVLLKRYVSEGPSEKELKTSKQFIMGSFPLSIANNGQMLDNISQIAFYHLPLDYLSTYRQKIAAVNGEAIKRAFQKAINTQNLITVTVGNEK